MNESIEDREASVVTQAVLAIRYIASLHFKDVEKVQSIPGSSALYISNMLAVF
jgi:hypothetical protein